MGKAAMNKPSWDIDRSKTSDRGYGWQWQKARRVHLMQQPLCVMCKAEGRVTAATVVDHITPHKGDDTLFWDTNNWQSLCATHHSRDKQVIERGGTLKPRIGLDGWPEG